MLSKSDILGYAIPPKEIEAFGGKVYISTMNGKQRDEYEKRMRKDDRQGLRAWLVVNTLCDEKGELLFTDKDIERFNSLPYKELDKIVLASLAVNEIDAQAIENLKKMLERMTTSDSASV